MLIEPPPTRADMHLRMLRLPVRVSPWFWLIGLVSGWDASPTLDFRLVWVAVLFVSILVHELGHALVARYFGARDGRIVLYGFGGLAINTGGLKRWQRIVECFAGPGAGFLLFGVVFLLARFALDPMTMSPLAQAGLRNLEWVCLWWGIVNLLPVYPLDGGQIAHELFLWRRPYDGMAMALKFSVAAAVVATAALGYLWYLGLTTGFPAFLFAILGVNNYFALRALRMGGLGAGIGGGFEAGHREAWERDADWWKA
jgi:Zn-dependent protease